MRSYSNDIPNNDKVAETLAANAAETEATAAKRHNTLVNFISVGIGLSVVNLTLLAAIVAQHFGLF